MLSYHLSSSRQVQNNRIKTDSEMRVTASIYLFIVLRTWYQFCCCSTNPTRDSLTKLSSRQKCHRFHYVALYLLTRDIILNAIKSKLLNFEVTITQVISHVLKMIKETKIRVWEKKRKKCLTKQNCSAYHGHLSSLMEISPYKFNLPGAEPKPDYVHVVSFDANDRQRQADDAFFMQNE